MTIIVAARILARLALFLTPAVWRRLPQGAAPGGLARHRSGAPLPGPRDTLRDQRARGLARDLQCHSVDMHQRAERRLAPDGAPVWRELRWLRAVTDDPKDASPEGEGEGVDPNLLASMTVLMSGPAGPDEEDGAGESTLPTADAPAGGAFGRL